MRILWLIILLIQFNYGLAQKPIVGKYRDHFGYEIELLADSTFEFSYHYDLASGWAIGVWEVSNNTIELTPVPVFDTLTHIGKSDSLVLSLNMDSERISEEQFAVDQITSGGQLPDYVPEKLYFKKGRLYKIKENGKIKRRKVKGLFTKKKFDPWYFKVK